jgi:ASC-1-like (ASCH) protein
MNSINVQQPYFDFIKNGQKTIEGRIRKDKFASIVEGDVIKICCDGQFITAYILGVRRYTSFYHYLYCEGLAKTLPNIDNINKGCNVYRKFYTYEQEKKFGIVAIELYIIV